MPNQKTNLILFIFISLITMPLLSEAGLIKVKIKNSIPNKVMDVSLGQAQDKGRRDINKVEPDKASNDIGYNQSSSQYVVDSKSSYPDDPNPYLQFFYKIYNDSKERNPIAWGAFQCTLERDYWHCPAFQAEGLKVLLHWTAGTQQADKAVLEAEVLAN